MADDRLAVMRRSIVVTRVLAPGNSVDFVLCPANPRRVAIMVGAGSITLFLNVVVMTGSSQGLQLPVSNTPVGAFNIWDHGDFVRREIHGWATSGSPAVFVMEILLEDDDSIITPTNPYSPALGVAK